jgi:FkbM family methyltransferase
MANLESLGYSRTITPVELYDDFVYELGNRYWLTQRNFYQAYKVEIETTARLFSDQASRDLFDAILSFRSSGDYRLLPEPAMQRQYFPVDIPAWKTPLRLVDCGAYDGDTLRSISALGISLDALAAFEPDEINFQKLAEAVRQGRIPNAHLWPCGVYSSTCKLHFSQGYGEASGIAMQGDATVQCLSLDDAIPSFAPTLIKMDIEGAEPEALTGAKSIIATYKPGLALSIYHAPAHLWEIPLWVSQFAKQNNIPYRYFLRAHGHNGFDTIFYAV